MNIEVTEKLRYGVPLYLPVCDDAARLCKLTRHTSLTVNDIKIIKELGFSVFRMTEVNGSMVRSEEL
jgi:hypothetical protein